MNYIYLFPFKMKFSTFKANINSWGITKFHHHNIYHIITIDYIGVKIFDNFLLNGISPLVKKVKLVFSVWGLLVKSYSDLFDQSLVYRAINILFSHWTRKRENLTWNLLDSSLNLKEMCDWWCACRFLYSRACIWYTFSLTLLQVNSWNRLIIWEWLC